MVINPNLQSLWVKKLYEEYHQIIYLYRLSLRTPVIQIEASSSRLGLWDPETRTLVLSEALLTRGRWEQVIEVMKHEIAHQWVTEVLGGDESHGPLFHRACERWQVAPWAARAEAELDLCEEIILEESQKKLLEKVEKLLALATSSNPFEAQSAMEKAQLLIEKHHLEHLKSTHKNYTYRIISFQKKKSERYQWAIASLLQDHFFVEIIFTTTFDSASAQTYRAIEVLGTSEKIKIAEYAYYFLENQLKQLWNDYKKVHLGISHKTRGSFYLGVLSGFREKLASSEKIRWQGELASALVTLKAPDPELENFIQKKYPRLRRNSYSNSINSQKAYESGKSEGLNLTFHHAVESKKNSQRFLAKG